MVAVVVSQHSFNAKYHGVRAGISACDDMTCKVHQIQSVGRTQNALDMLTSTLCGSLVSLSEGMLTLGCTELL